MVIGGESRPIARRRMITVAVAPMRCRRKWEKKALAKSVL